MHAHTNILQITEHNLHQNIQLISNNGRRQGQFKVNNYVVNQV